MRVQNTDFVCEICGKRDIVLSSLRLQCNYGSANDGEKLRLNICGTCADMVYERIQKKKSEAKRGRNNNRSAGL